MALLLGIDIGTTGTRVLVCDERGELSAAATADHAEPTGDGPGWSEQDPRDWWRATREAVSAAVREGGVDAGDIAAIGLSGQMHGSVFLDERDEVLRPAILWNDQRTAAECDAIEQAVGGRDKLVELVGNPALTGFTAPKILWLRAHEPRHYEKTRRVLLPKDYIRHQLTGEYATDVGDASGTLLLDVRRRTWNADVLARLEIDANLLPTCHESHEITGTLTDAAASALGLTPGTPVVGGSGDQPAGAVGNGIVRTGIASATLGTSGVVFVHSDEPTYDPHGRVHTMCSAVAGKWCVFGCMLSAGGSFQWLRNRLGQHEVDEANRRGVDPYELLIEHAAQAPAGSGGLFFLPYLTGERCPHPDPLARGGWIGLTARHDRCALIRAVIEGVTFGMTDMLRIMQAMGIAVDTMRLSGGGSRSAFWRQLQADAYAMPTATINASEGPAYGAALLAGVGAGVWRDVPEACDAAIHETERREPDTDRAALYAKHHAQYQRLYDALRDEFPRIAALG